MLFQGREGVRTSNGPQEFDGCQAHFLLRTGDFLHKRALLVGDFRSHQAYLRLIGAQTLTNGCHRYRIELADFITVQIK